MSEREIDHTAKVNYRKRNRFLRWLAEGLLLAGLLVGIGFWRVQDLPSGAAPPLRGALLDGAAFDLDALRGRPVLVHFWGTWCPVCRLESDTIAALARRHAVIAVSIGEPSAAVRRYFDAEGIRFPVLVDTNGRLQADWRVRAVPASFVLDRQGRIRFRSVGYTTRAGLEFRLWLADRMSGGGCEDGEGETCP